MAHFTESSTQPFTTGVLNTDAGLDKFDIPAGDVPKGGAMRILLRAVGVGDQVGKVTPELNHVPLLAAGVVITGAGADVVADLLLWRTGDTQGRIGGTTLAADGTLVRIPDVDVTDLAWTRAQLFRFVGFSNANGGVRLETYGIQR